MRDVQREIERLARMTMRGLRETYAELFGEPTRSGNWRWLFRRCVWRVQAPAEGGLPQRVRRRPLEMADDADARVIPPHNKDQRFLTLRTDLPETPVVDARYGVDEGATGRTRSRTTRSAATTHSPPSAPGTSP